MTGQPRPGGWNTDYTTSPEERRRILRETVAQLIGQGCTVSAVAWLLDVPLTEVVELAPEQASELASG